MNKAYLILILALFFTGQPPVESTAQRDNMLYDYRVMTEPRRDYTKEEKARLFKEANANLDTLAIQAKKNKTKLVYVKVYKTVPIYVPVDIDVADTLKGTFFLDTLISDINIKIDTVFDKKESKKSFIKKLLNR